MSALNDRMREVIASATHENDRYKTLEEQTGIAKERWSNFMKGKQNATFDMIEHVCRLWENCMPYIVIGKGPRPLLSPDEDTYVAIPTLTGGITLKRDKKGFVVTNVAHVINHRGHLISGNDPAHFEFGYEGNGPRELAANILFQFRVNEKDAHLFAADFSREIIAYLPHQEAYLSAERVREWINFRLPELRKKKEENDKAWQSKE